MLCRLAVRRTTWARTVGERTLELGVSKSIIVVSDGGDGCSGFVFFGDFFFGCVFYGESPEMDSGLAERLASPSCALYSLPASCCR